MVQEWLKIARTELNTAKVLSSLGIEHANIVLFLSQQVAEKSIKAYLVFLRKKIKKTHDINELTRDINVHDDSLKNLLDGAHFLTQYAAKFRYPQLVEQNLTGEEVSKALKIAEDVYKNILQKINE